MTYLPIVGRELRVAARHRSTYWERVTTAVLALGLSILAYAITQQFPPQMVGRTLFRTLAWLAFIHCVLAGTRLTADCISSEKREGTLGLLFLTDLRGLDVALGKLAARGLGAFYSLLAIFPVLGVGLLLGGVTALDLGRTALVLLNTMFLSLAVGLTCSTFCRRAQRSAGLAFLVLLGIVLGPIGAAALWVWLNDAMQPPFEFLLPTPLLPFGLASQSWPIPNATRLLWISMLLIQLLAWLLLSIASGVLPRVWQDRPTTPLGVRWRRRWQQWAYGSPAQRRKFRQKLLDRNAFFWLAARDRLKPAYAWVFVAGVAALWLWAWLYHRDMVQDTGLYLFTAVIVQGVFKFWLGTAAVERLAEDKRSTALELILSTPLTTAEIFQGQWRALARQFAGPVAAVLVGDALLAYGTWQESTYSERGLSLLWFGAVVVVFLVDLWAIGWRSLWTAVAARQANQAAASALAPVLLLPWALLFGVVMVLARLGRFDLEAGVWVGIWFGFSLATDIGCFLLARDRLENRFREVATHRFLGPKRGILGWLFPPR